MNAFRRFSENFKTLKTGVATLAATRKLRADTPFDYSDLLETHVRNRPDRPALIGESSSMTWQEFDAYANRVAHWGLSKGLTRGSVVALLMENRPEFIAIWVGLSRIGAVTAMLNTNLTGDRLAHCLREAEAGYWIVGAELAEAAESAMPHLENPPEVLISEEAGAEPSGRSAGFDSEIADQPNTKVNPSIREARRGSDLLFFIYTSGTTGLPKAARISHLKAATTGLGSSKMQGLTPRDRTYCCLPLYHSAGGMMAVGASLFSGGALVIARRFSAKRFWSDCTQHEVTSFQYIGELCRYLLNSPPHPDERSHKLRVIVGNGLRPEIWEDFQKRFQIPRIAEFYGATEGNFALFNANGQVGAVGYLPGFLRKSMGVEIVRFDIDKEEILRDASGLCARCDADEPGELVIKISETTQFEGYTNPEATEKKVLRDAFEKGDAYFRSGDLLRIDEDGYFYFVDRIGDTFRWKGENVATSEVSEVISVDPGIDEANVYGVPISGTDGRAGMAALVTNENFDVDRLGALIEKELAFYAKPLFLRVLPQMEITGTFKHRKVDLVREGFDPSSLADALYLLDPNWDGAGPRYIPLDAETHRQIEAGEIRV
ncbi:MAG: long-chain-acyl-CoA synthetase [Myxococcota bacterium]